MSNTTRLNLIKRLAYLSDARVRLQHTKRVDIRIYDRLIKQIKDLSLQVSLMDIEVPYDSQEESLLMTVGVSID